MQFRSAQPEDAATIASVLTAAAADLRERGLALWSAAEVAPEAVVPHVHAGLYHLGLEGAVVVGVFRLQSSDPSFWPEIPEGTSLYLHKLAVLPERQGHGLAHLLLQHAVDITRVQGRRFLRLDCMGGRPRLRAVYERFGFRHHSQVVLSGQAFERFALDVDAMRA